MRTYLPFMVFVLAILSAGFQRDKEIVGSKIALLGCPPQEVEVLGTLGTVEVAEGLCSTPYWKGYGPRNPRSSAYLIQEFGIQTIDKAIALTKKSRIEISVPSRTF